MRPELIQASNLLRRNTPEAVDEAIGLLQNTVYSFSMKVCGHPEDAEDTMQEVLSRSLQHLAKIQDPQALAVWLYTVTRNRCWRMRRKGASAPKHILSLDELMPDEAELGRLLQDAAAGPEANLLHAEQHHLLHQAVLRVSAQLRIVLVLHDMEELTTEQVAQVLGLQPGTVGSASIGRALLYARRWAKRWTTYTIRRRAAGQSVRSRRTFESKTVHAPPSAANCSRISLSIWMAGLSRSLAKRCAATSRPALPASHSSATCGLPSTAAARWRFPATLPLRLACVPSSHRSTCACWGFRAHRNNLRRAVTNRRPRVFVLLRGEDDYGSDD